MAGQPKRRAMIAELTKRASAMEVEEGQAPADVLDYVVGWIEDGGNLTTLAEDLGRAVGDTIQRSKLSTYLHSLPKSEERLSRARVRSADALVESVAKVLEDDVETNVELGARKQQIDYKLWVASRLNREVYGDAKQAQVSISISGLHLEALRVRKSTVTLTTSESPALPAPAEDAEFEVLPAS